jgi:hypothetical protein
MFYPKIVWNHRQIAVAFLLASVTINTVFAKSVQAGGYSVGPLVNIVSLDRSQARATINVTNTGNEPVRVRIYVEDFTYERNAGFTTVPNHPYSATQYLQFSPREIVVPPKVTRNVRVNVLIPSSAPDGEYRAVVFAEELIDNSAPQSGSTLPVKFRIGSVFFVQKGSGNNQLSVSGVEWDQQERHPRLLLVNKGTITNNPSIQWKIDRNGKEVDTGSVLSVIVQNNSERAVELKTMNGKLPPGEYTVSGQVQRSKTPPIPFSFKFKVP